MLTALLCLLVMSSVFTAFKTADATLPTPATHEAIKANPALFGFRPVDKARLAASSIITKFGPNHAAVIESLTTDFNVFINEATNTLHIQRKVISATAGKGSVLQSIIETATLSPVRGVIYPGGPAYISGKGTIVVTSKYASDFQDAADTLSTAWIH